MSVRYGSKVVSTLYIAKLTSQTSGKMRIGKKIDLPQNLGGSSNTIQWFRLSSGLIGHVYLIVPLPSTLSNLVHQGHSLTIHMTAKVCMSEASYTEILSHCKPEEADAIMSQMEPSKVTGTEYTDVVVLAVSLACQLQFEGCISYLAH